jgi:hypothetical protein
VGGVVDKGKVVGKKLLGNVADDVNVAGVVQDLSTSTAITEPKEVAAPYISAVLTNSSAAGNGFTNERVEVFFSIGAAARSKSDRPLVDTRHEGVKGVVSAFL